MRTGICLTTISRNVKLALIGKSKGSEKVEIKELKKTLAEDWLGCFWFKYLSDEKSRLSKI